MKKRKPDAFSKALQDLIAWGYVEKRGKLYFLTARGQKWVEEIKICRPTYEVVLLTIPNPKPRPVKKGNKRGTKSR